MAETFEYSVDLSLKIATSSISNDVDLLSVMIVRVLAARNELISSWDFEVVRVHIDLASSSSDDKLSQGWHLSVVDNTATVLGFESFLFREKSLLKVRVLVHLIECIEVLALLVLAD